MPSVTGHPVVCFGPDRVKSFLQANNLSLILRAHECVMDGFQRFAVRPIQIDTTPHPGPCDLLLAHQPWALREPSSLIGRVGG